MNAMTNRNLPQAFGIDKISFTDFFKVTSLKTCPDGRLNQ
jgi:hypothetical protein